MKRNTKALIGSLFLFALVFSVNAGSKTNLPQREELTRKTLVQAIGVDKLSDDAMRVTFAPAMSRDQESLQGSTEEINNVVIGDGRTFFEALKKAQTYMSNTVYLGQVDLIIVGEEAARDDLGKYIDFVTRDQDMRMNLHIVVAKGTTAEEVLRCNSDDGATSFETIQSLLLDAGEMSYSSEIQLRQVVQATEEETLDPILPAVTIAKKEEGTGGAATISIEGYGVFQDTKLLRYLEKDAAKAYNLLTGRFQNSVAVLSVEDIGKLSAQLLNASVDLSVQEEDGKPAFTFRVDLAANITERVGLDGTAKAQELRFTEDTMQQLEDNLSSQLKDEMQRVIAQAQADGVDYLGLADHLYRSDPDWWDRVKDRWETLYPTLTVKVEMKSQILSFYTVNQGLGMEE